MSIRIFKFLSIGKTGAAHQGRRSRIDLFHRDSILLKTKVLISHCQSVGLGRSRSVGRAFLTCARFDDKIRESTSDFRQHIYNAAALSSWCY
ncbi:MAG: hypothetical protein DMG57_38215 [Acidobacteria bacterium]|nr:MAG: hypothetical protein DMG57_38215 [Acidobacteriota bacterium]